MKGGWVRSWSVGFLEFEIEWVPAVRYYVFALTWDRTPEKSKP